MIPSHQYVTALFAKEMICGIIHTKKVYAKSASMTNMRINACVATRINASTGRGCAKDATMASMRNLTINFAWTATKINASSRGGCAKDAT